MANTTPLNPLFSTVYTQANLFGSNTFINPSSDADRICLSNSFPGLEIYTIPVIAFEWEEGKDFVTN